MDLKIITCVFAMIWCSSHAKVDPQNLRCLVCRTTFNELNKVVMKVDRKKMVDIGNFRMDASGNTNQNKVPAHRSDVYISELLEGVCTKLNDYVRVQYKSTGKLDLMLLMTPEGGMNPDFNKITFVTDDDLNKSLEYYCERIFEENEEEILSLYKNRPEDEVMPDAEQAICYEHAKYCEQWMIPNSDDKTWTREMEMEYVKVHGPDPYGFGGFGGGDLPSLSDINPEQDFEDQTKAENLGLNDEL